MICLEENCYYYVVILDRYYPRVIKGSSRDVLNACLNGSKLWKHIHMLHLRSNARIKQLEKQKEQLMLTDSDLKELRAFDVQLQQIGAGNYTETVTERNLLPKNWISLASTLDEFIVETFPNLVIDISSNVSVQG